MVHARAVIGDQAKAIARAGDQRGVDIVGHGRDQHVAIGHRGGQLVAAELGIAVVVGRVEQRRHTVHDRIGEFARDDHLGVGAAPGVGPAIGAWIGHDCGLANVIHGVNDGAAKPRCHPWNGGAHA
jgi:hypothetical protein